MPDKPEGEATPGAGFTDPPLAKFDSVIMKKTPVKGDGMPEFAEDQGVSKFQEQSIQPLGKAGLAK